MLACTIPGKPPLTEAFIEAPTSNDDLVVFEVEAEAEILALKEMSMSLIAR
jgi:hypothetical protein